MFVEGEKKSNRITCSVPCTPSISINYSSHPIGHAFPQCLKVCLWYVLPDLRPDFDQPCFHFVRASGCVSNFWGFPIQPALELYPDMFNWVDVWGIGWPVLHLEVVFLKKIYRHSCFVYCSILMLEDGIPYGVMDIFKDWEKKILKKLDTDTLDDWFDNKRADSSTVPILNRTPNHQGNPITIWFWCSAVFEPRFRWFLKYPNMSRWITVLHWAFVTVNNFCPLFMCPIHLLMRPLQHLEYVFVLNLCSFLC